MSTIRERNLIDRFLKITITNVLFVALAISCQPSIWSEGEEHNSAYVFQNDTEYDCQITWDDSWEPENTNQEIVILSDSVYVQQFFPSDGTGLPSDGNSIIVLGLNTRVRFMQTGTVEIINEYCVPQEESKQINSMDYYWSRLPHYKYNIDGYRNVHTFYLSDVLEMAQSK